MRINGPLFLWMFRPLRGLTIVTAITASAYVLFHDQPLYFPRDTATKLFIVIHCFLISRLAGRVRSETFAFLYSQGFSRDTLWSHMWLATAASVLATWLPCAVLILTPLRSSVQDYLLNPWFPLMSPTERPFLMWSLFLYFLLVPVFHYEWIRSSMPFRGVVNGHLLAVSYFVFAGLLTERFWQFSPDTARMWLAGGFVLVSAILGLFGCWMHRRMEVCS